jgi:predicted nucleic acid-binding protein
VYLFDASSIVNLIKKGIAKLFAEGATLDLALYESINAVWKEYKLLRRIDRSTALMFIEIINNVFNVIRTLSIRGLEKEVFDLASKENFTIYDASYVCVSRNNKLTLITDDQRLRSKASKYVRVITSSELATTFRS